MSQLTFEEKVYRAREAGFSDEEIRAEMSDGFQRAIDAGFAPDEIESAMGIVTEEPGEFGINIPQTKEALETTFRANLLSSGATVANDPMELMAAGWQMSTASLAFGKPDTVAPEDSALWQDLLYGAGMLAGDLPAGVGGAVGGFFAGGSAGTAVAPGPGTVVGSIVGAGAGSAAVPEAIRSVLIDGYVNGEIKDWDDFFSRATNVLANVGTEAVTGAVAAPIGGAVGSKLVGATGSRTIGAIGGAVAEATAYTAVGGALRGQVPEPQDFVAGLVFATTLGAGGKAVALLTPQGRTTPAGELVTSAYMEAYRDTGLPPWQVADLAAKDPVVAQDLYTVGTNGRPIQTGLRGHRLDEPEKPPANAISIADEHAAETDSLKGQAQTTFNRDAMTPEGRAKKYADLANRDAAAEELALRLTTKDAGTPEGRAKKYAALVATAERVPMPTLLERFAASEAGTLEGDAVRPLTTDESAVLSRVAKRPKDSVAVLAPNRIHRQFVNRFEPVMRMEGDVAPNLPADQSPSILVRQTLASDMRASYMLRSGSIDPHTKKKVSDTSYLGGVKHAVDAGGDVDGLRAYMIAARALELEARGVDTGIPLAEANAVVAAGKKTYAKATREMNKARTEKLEYARKAGLLTEKSVKAMKDAGDNYAPLKRVIEDEPTRAEVAGKGLRARNPIKKLVGSKEKFVDPILSDFENFHILTAMADRNIAMETIVNQIDADPQAMAPFVQKTTRKVDIANDPETKAWLDAHGITADEAATLLTFRSARKSLAPDEALYFREGKPEVYKFTDPDLAALYRGATPEETNLLTTIAYGLAKAQRAGITLTPDFATKGALRDQLSVAVLTNHGFVPFWDAMRGVMSVIKQDKWFDDWSRTGGAGAALTSMDADYFIRDVHRLFEKTGVASKIWNVVRHPIEAAQLFQEMVDASSRVGLYKRKLAKYDDPSKATTAERFEAATASRTALLDFAQGGTLQIVNQLARATPFLRPNLLGLEQLVRAFKERPATTTLKGIAMVTMPSIALYALNMMVDPEGYQDLPRWQRDLFWILPPINGVRIRIPKPPVIGQLFGSLPERALDHAYLNDKRAFKDWGETFASSLIPPVVPAAILPMMEAWGGKSVFTGRQLVPESLEGLSGYMQYTPNTTELAKKLSRFLSPKAGIGLRDVSPVVLENFVRGWAGTLGIDVLRALSSPLKKSNTPWDVADIPVVRAFVIREPSLAAAPIQNFWDEVKEFEKANGDFRVALRRANDGEIDLAAADIRAFVQLASIKDAINAQYASLQALDQDEKMTMDERRQYIESTYAGMIETAREGLRVFDSLGEQE